MTYPFGEVSARRRPLGLALRELRTRAGLSGEQLARQVDISQSQVSRIELGQQAAPVALVQQWAEATGAGGEDLAEVLRLAESAATQTTTWRSAMQRGLATLQEDSRELEATAGTILNFSSMRVPGLLQVPEYARRVFAAGNPPGHPDIAAAVAVRVSRQAVLYEVSKRLEFVMAEVALLWPIAPPGVMRAQLDRISVVSGLENVRIGIIPLDAEISVWHDHGFNILDDRGDGPVVHVETLTTGLTIRDPADVSHYREAFDKLLGAAVFGSEADQILQRAASRYQIQDLQGLALPSSARQIWLSFCRLWPVLVAASRCSGAFRRTDQRLAGRCRCGRKRPEAQASGPLGSVRLGAPLNLVCDHETCLPARDRRWPFGRGRVRRDDSGIAGRSTRRGGGTVRLPSGGKAPRPVRRTSGSRRSWLREAVALGCSPCLGVPGPCTECDPCGTRFAEMETGFSQAGQPIASAAKPRAGPRTGPRVRRRAGPRVVVTTACCQRPLVVRPEAALPIMRYAGQRLV